MSENQLTKSNEEEYLPPIEIRKFVAVLMNEGHGSVMETERITKISRFKFWWQLRRAKDKGLFQKWYINQVDAFLASYEASVSRALISKIAEGDIQAMRLYYELRSRLKAAGGINIATLGLPGARQPLIIIGPGADPDQETKPKAIDVKGEEKQGV